MKTLKLRSGVALLLTLLCLGSFVSCGGDSDDPSAATTTEKSKDENPQTPRSIDVAALKDEIIADLQVTDSVDIAADLLLDLYGIAAEDVAEASGYMTMDGVFPDEVIMVKAVDDAAAGRIADALNRRLEEVKIQSENYDPENYALAQKCKVQSEGVYVVMFLSPHYDRMTELFEGFGK